MLDVQIADGGNGFVPAQALRRRVDAETSRGVITRALQHDTIERRATITAVLEDRLPRIETAAVGRTSAEGLNRIRSSIAERVSRIIESAGALKGG